MAASVKNLTRLASPETGNVTLWHYVTADDPMAEGYFNPFFQMLGENDIIITIIAADKKPPVTVILTVEESSKDGVKVRLPLPAPVDIAVEETKTAKKGK